MHIYSKKFDLIFFSVHFKGNIRCVYFDFDFFNFRFENKNNKKRKREKKCFILNETIFFLLVVTIGFGSILLVDSVV